jgi:hypothetical protein
MSMLSGGDAFSTFDQTEPGYAGTYGPATHTVADVMQAVRRQFGDDAGVQVEDPDLIRWINDAQTTIVTRNRIIKARSTVLSVPGQNSYRWPTEQILQVESIHYDDFLIPNMAFASAEARIKDDPKCQGQPKLWYEFAGRFTFWPTPADEKAITLYLTLKPTVVANVADLLSVPDKYFADVVRYVMLQAYEMDEDWDAVKAKQDQFDQSVNALASDEGMAQNATYPVIQVVDEY